MRTIVSNIATIFVLCSIVTAVVAVVYFSVTQGI